MTINVTRTEREAGQMLSNAYTRETHPPIRQTARNHCWVFLLTRKNRWNLCLD
ncbi:MAG TPA: hypothetical protein VE288_13260 [Rubrobacteraceae bacterium]|nr:hypothetical protein [Rubrobacteraceae bacterium]